MPVYTTTTDARVNRALAYERLATMFQHLDALNVNVTAIVLNADGTVSVTTNAAISAAQRAHVGLG